MRGGNVDIIGVNGDIVMERGEEKSIEQFLGDTRGSGRHCVLERWQFDHVSFIFFIAQAFIAACSGDSHKSQQLDPERTSPTPRPKSLLKEGILSIAPGTVDFNVSHGSKT